MSSGLRRMHDHRGKAGGLDFSAYYLPFAALEKARNSYQGPVRASSAGGVAAAAPKTNLDQLLFTAMASVCSDRRDHVYSLLGLIRTVDGSPLATCIPPDYTKTVSWAYCNAVKMFLELEGTLDFLDLRSTLLPQPWLPSWVPDFSYWSDNLEKTCPELSGDWRAAGPIRPIHNKLLPRILGEEASVLVAQGSILDRVTGSVDISPSQTLRDIRRAVLSKTQGSPNGTLSHFCDAPPDLDESLWRTLVTDQSLALERPCPEEYQDYYKELLSVDGLDTDGITPGAAKFQKAMRQRVAHCPWFPCRQLLLFEKMGFGLGPPDGQVGDMLCLLAGYSKPVILRPCGGHFQFVGDVYVHGIMYGEALSEHELSEEFVIR